MHAVESGTQVSGWTIPDEYKVTEAYIELEDGRRVANYSYNFLHLVGYSNPVDTVLTKAEIDSHVHRLPDYPDVIPYITSYYKENWGFCLSEREWQSLPDCKYRAYIDSTKFKGVMNYADVVIPGKSTTEILISTYICHPMMTNDGISGIVVATALARWIESTKERNFTYRFVFVPETIGAIYYIGANISNLRQTVAGFVVTCCGDNGAISLVPSRIEKSNANQAIWKASRIFKDDPDYSDIPLRSYQFIERGSDERQYCWPGIDLPVACVTRSKFGTFDEYHTSADDLSFISEDKLNDTVEFMKCAIRTIEFYENQVVLTDCEPHLMSHVLYPETSPNTVPDILNVLAYCDKMHPTKEIASICNLSESTVLKILETVREKGLLG